MALAPDGLSLPFLPPSEGMILSLMSLHRSSLSPSEEDSTLSRMPLRSEAFHCVDGTPDSISAVSRSLGTL